MEVRIAGAAPINLHRYTDASGNWGWVLRRLINDGLHQRDFVALPTSHGLVSIGGIRTEPREWQIVLDVWGRSYADLQAARAFLTRQFPVPYSDADLITIEARVSSAVAWRQIRALCTAIDWDEEDERFRATATLKLFSPQPYWSYETSVTFTPQPVLSSVSCVRLELSSGVVTTYNFGSTQLRRVHFVNPSLAYAGASNNTSVWELYVGSQAQLSAIPAGSSIGGVRRLSNGTIIAGLFDDGAVNPVYFWTGGGWSQIGYSPAMNGGIRRIGGTSNSAEYWVSGLFTQPRKLFAVFTDSHSLVTTYEDVFSDLTINTIGEAICIDAYVEENVVLAVARRQASPFTRWVRVGSLAGKTDLLSWNSNANDNFATTIAGYSVHDVLVAGNFSSVANQIFGLQRCVRLRNLGGVEQAGDVSWGSFLGVKRCGSRIFAYTT
ncbi:MAG: hypothetical protein N2545_05705, partial [Thermoflexales bacterium]|nr:hypothetical protein [Thermoflexales bacterium]